MPTYTTISGREIDYDEPTGALARFLKRVRAAGADPKTKPSDLILLIYGADNPLLERGHVTRAAFENPLYHVMADILGRKEVGDRVEEVAAAFTMSPQEAADRRGMHVSAVRQAIERGKIPAWRKGDRWYLDPRDVDGYQVSDTGPRQAKAKTGDGTELGARFGTMPDGTYLRVKRLGLLDIVTMPASGNVHDARILAGWKRLAVETSSGNKTRFFVLEPAPEKGELVFGEFYVRGNFKIASHENNARRAREAWAAFEPE